MAVHKKLQQIGHSRGLILPSVIIDMLGWVDEQELELRVEGRRLTLAPVERQGEPAAKEPPSSPRKRR